MPNNDNDSTPADNVKCHCGNEIGQRVKFGRHEFIRLGGVILYSAHGRCSACNREWHFVSEDVLLRRILARRLSKQSVS